MSPFHDGTVGVSGGPPGPASLGAATLFPVPASRPGVGVGAFLLAILTAGALAHVGVRLKGLEVAYDLGRERHIASEMEEQHRRLQIEIGMLKDPRRIISIARDKLNMGAPAPQAIWRLGSGMVSHDSMLSGGIPTAAIATAHAVAATEAASQGPATSMNNLAKARKGGR